MSAEMQHPAALYSHSFLLCQELMSQDWVGTLQYGKIQYPFPFQSPLLGAMQPNGRGMKAEKSLTHHQQA